MHTEALPLRAHNVFCKLLTAFVFVTYSRFHLLSVKISKKKQTKHLKQSQFSFYSGIIRFKG